MRNFYEEQEIPNSKRARFMIQETSAASTDTSLNTMDGNSPLGLKLRKSPSLLDLVQLSLSRMKNQEALGYHTVGSIQGPEDIENQRCTVVHSTANDKKKATNFSASILRIGSWECVSRYEGDLVVKCYFAKRKLVWEVLEGGLKSKIEIQWSDITGLKATCPENKSSTLDIELSRPPMFFKESNPQPRKHTIWQATSDFTGGQATIYRKHFLQFPEGVLDKNYQSLVQSDARLNLLSKKGLAGTEFPFFDSRFAPFSHHQISYWPREENLSHLLPQSQSVYLNSDCYLPPLASLPETQKMAMAAPISLMTPNYDLSQLEDRERLSAVDTSDSMSQEETSRLSNKRTLDEIAQYLLGDTATPDQEQSMINKLTSTMRSLRQKEFHQWLRNNNVENCDYVPTGESSMEMYPRRW